MKNIFTLFFLLSGIFTSFSQILPKTEIEIEIEKERNEILDELLQEDSELDELIASLSSYQLLYVSVNYNNDTYFSGRDIGVDQYNLRPQITYLNSSGIFASLYGIYYSELQPNWDVTTATLGYSKSFGKTKTYKYYGFYSKYFYTNNSDNLFSNVLNAGLSVRNKKNSIGTQLTASYLFGNEQSFQIASTSYVNLQILKTRKSTLTFKPQLYIVAAKQTIELAQSYTHMGQVFTSYSTNDVFNLINTQLNIPLHFNTNSFDFELGYNINFPNAIGDETNLKNTGFFNFSLGYLIDL